MLHGCSLPAVPHALACLAVQGKHHTCCRTKQYQYNLREHGAAKRAFGVFRGLERVTLSFDGSEGVGQVGPGVGRVGPGWGLSAGWRGDEVVEGGQIWGTPGGVHRTVP